MASLVEVALPVPLFRTFTYEVNGDVAHPVAAGSRVVVPFRQRREIGIVVGEGKPRPGISPKQVLEVPDAQPVIEQRMLALCRWLAEYYIVPLGVALRCALPGALSGA
ncbi:MAG: primosomal protein N', partial [Gemmatimonadota bacterium]|nr:primosomal protein N' [Gemmatimonadota bacterium]